MVKGGALRFGALWLLGYLAGSVAVRMNTRATERQLLAQQAVGPESNFQQENCSWSWWNQQCLGDGCQYQHMILDTRSQWCRLSDDHMLQKGGYVERQNTLMNAKAKKFAEHCLSLGWHNIVGNAKCKRRMVQVMRATTFLAKAEGHDEMKNMTSSQKWAQLRLLKNATKTLLGAAGDDGALVIDALQRLEGDANSTKSNPAEMLMKLMNTTVRLLAGSDAEKQAARESIRNWPNSMSTLSAAEAQMVSSSQTDSENGGPSVEETDRLLDKGRQDFEAKLTNTNSTGSLLQVQGASTSGFVFVAPLLAVMVVMMMAVFFSLIFSTVFLTAIIGFFVGLAAMIGQMFLFILSLPYLILFR